MAYTVKLNGGTYEQAEKVRLALIAKLEKSKTFKANCEPVQFFYKGSREGSRAEGYGFTIKKVRLRKAKPYCGNHPGECFVTPGVAPRKKPVMSLPEWDDWVKFNNFVNALLNRLRKNADVWSMPPDARGIMWMRKGLKARKVYNWTTDAQNPRLKHWDRGNDPLSY